MKKFITTLFWLVAPIALLCGAAVFTEWQVFRRAVRYPQCKIGIIGDSRAACGINPEYFPELANFAQRTTQSMVWRAKLDVILDENPQLEKFIVELSPVSLYRMAETPIYERGRFLRGHIPAMALLDVMRGEKMGAQTGGLSRNFIRGILFPFMSRVFTGSAVSALQDGYTPLDCKVKETAWWKAGGHVEKGAVAIPANRKTGVLREVEEVIVELQRRNLRVELLTMPFWPYSKVREFDGGELVAFAEDMRYLCDKYSIQWRDYCDAIPDDDHWGDSGHLNRAGAQKITNVMRRDLGY